MVGFGWLAKLVTSELVRAEVEKLKAEAFQTARDEVIPLVKEAARQEAQYLVQQEMAKLNGGLPK